MKGHFWAANCHILVTSYCRKWTKHTYAAHVMMSVLWQKVIKNCATNYKTSHRLLMVGSNLPLQLCLALFWYMRYLWVILEMFIIWNMRVCDSDVECIYLLMQDEVFPFNFVLTYMRSSCYLYEASNWIALNQDMWSQTNACSNKSECKEERKNRAWLKLPNTIFFFGTLSIIKFFKEAHCFWSQLFFQF